MLLCKFCSKECKNGNSLRNHERTCPINPNRQKTYFSSEARKLDERCKTNQYIKAAKEGLPKPIVSDETRNKIRISNSLRTPEWHEENAKRISETVNKKVAEGTWHTSLAKNMHIDYNGIDLHGSWELKYVTYLDKNNIKWARNKDSFAYIFEEKERKYTPDFYLIDSDEYVEIKGYKTNKDDAKWSHFPKHRKLIVLLKEDLIKLGIEL